MKGSALAIPPKGLPFGNPVCFKPLINRGAGARPCRCARSTPVWRRQAALAAFNIVEWVRALGMTLQNAGQKPVELIGESLFVAL